MKKMNLMNITSFDRPNFSRMSGSLFLAFLLFMMGNVSLAQERQNVSVNSLEAFNEGDLNSDQEWDLEEFNAWTSEEGIFEGWDTDEDNLFSGDEVREGVTQWEDKEHVIGNYAVVDVNTVEDSARYPYATSPRLNLDIMDDWDLDNDGYYSEAERNEWMFDYWDQDKDGVLGYEEYNALNSWIRE